MKQGYDQNYTNKNGAKYNKYTVNYNLFPNIRGYHICCNQFITDMALYESKGGERKLSGGMNVGCLLVSKCKGESGGECCCCCCC